MLDYSLSEVQNTLQGKVNSYSILEEKSSNLETIKINNNNKLALDIVVSGLNELLNNQLGDHKQKLIHNFNLYIKNNNKELTFNLEKEFDKFLEEYKDISKEYYKYSIIKDKLNYILLNKNKNSADYNKIDNSFNTSNNSNVINTNNYLYLNSSNNSNKNYCNYTINNSSGVDYNILKK